MPYGLHRKNYISPPKTFFRSYTTPIMSSRYLPYRPQSIIPAPHQQTEERNSGNLLSNCSPEILPWYKTRGGSWARQPQIIPMARYYKYKYSTISHSNIDMHPFEYENGPSEKSYK
ncbi:unnamed protein product [Orchesella dallaii]|uniref:Uncharacterized protein n=1 Tax=Orchesella dallaii TaxID=48710 RepID=A0ABP1RQY7_9HEXA